MTIILFFVAVALANLLAIYSIIKKNVLNESESIFWMTFSIFLVVLPPFMYLIPVFAKYIGIHYPPSLLFTLAFMFCIFMLFRASVTVSILGEKVKDLAQANAIMEKEFNDQLKLNVGTESESGLREMEPIPTWTEQHQ
jgi:hypothetical protein